MSNYVENGYIVSGYFEGGGVIDRGSGDAFKYGNHTNLPDDNTPMVITSDGNRIIVDDSGNFSINNHPLNVNEVIRILCSIDNSNGDDVANISLLRNIFDPKEIAIILDKYSDTPTLSPTPHYIYENTSIDIFIDNYSNTGNYTITSNIGNCVKFPGNPYFTFTPISTNMNIDGIISISLKEVGRLESLTYNRAISVINNSNLFDSLLFNNDYSANELSNDGFTY